MVWLIDIDSCARQHIMIICKLNLLKKQVNIIAKWIDSSDVLVTWSPPVNHNQLIDG